MVSTTLSSLSLRRASANGLRGVLYSGVDLSVDPGTCHCITGPTGSGKSTLLRTLAGLHGPGPHGQALLNNQSVTAALPGRIGLILQNPDTQLLCPDVGSELAFGLENLCVPPAEMNGRMLRAMGRVGLDLPLDQAVTTLSVGQKYKLLLAAMLVMEPDVLLLDEPCAQLDQAGIAAVNAVLKDFLARGGMAVICEHDPAPLDVITHVHALRDQTLAPACPVVRQALPSPPPLQAGAAVVSVHSAAVTLGQIPLWQNVSLTLVRGEIALLHGANGSGKTTLLRCLTGFQHLSHGEARVLGAVPRPAALRGRVGYLIQNPARQLTADTVAEQVAQPLHFLRVPPARRNEQVAAVLDSLGLARLADQPPFLLSHGEQHLVALAAVLAPRPELLLLDDPFVGLDAACTRLVWAMLHQASMDGTAVLCALHRRPCVHAAHSLYHVDAQGVHPC